MRVANTNVLQTKKQGLWVCVDISVIHACNDMLLKLSGHNCAAVQRLCEERPAVQTLLLSSLNQLCTSCLHDFEICLPCRRPYKLRLTTTSRLEQSNLCASLLQLPFYLIAEWLNQGKHDGAIYEAMAGRPFCPSADGMLLCFMTSVYFW